MAICREPSSKRVKSGDTVSLRGLRDVVDPDAEMPGLNQVIVEPIGERYKSEVSVKTVYCTQRDRREGAYLCCEERTSKRRR
jgi:hypothetical protein